MSVALCEGRAERVSVGVCVGGYVKRKRERDRVDAFLCRLCEKGER